MTEVFHVKEYRLFDRSKAEVEGKHFPLLVWEEEHLRDCTECQEVAGVFSRLCKGKPRLFNSGQMNFTSAWYRNLCCSFDLFIMAGKPFPDCRRHRNLPTSWKLLDEGQAAIEKTSA